MVTIPADTPVTKLRLVTVAPAIFEELKDDWEVTEKLDPSVRKTVAEATAC
jgi:hypothetical protein